VLRSARIELDGAEGKEYLMTECWEWEGQRDYEGYGRTGKNKLAHREMYKTFVARFNESLCVLHKCDNPPCIRPSHLYQGSQKDNAEDRQVRGRNRGALQPCELNRNARFTKKQVNEIRSQLTAGKSAYKIAKEIGCSKRTISMIRDSKTWRHLMVNVVDDHIVGVAEQVGVKV